MKFLFGGKSKAPTPQETGRHIRISNPWHAVAVRSSRAACPACKAIAGVRFLAREAPKLPLANCHHAAVCHSTYEHFDDRREGPRRNAEQEFPRMQAPPPPAERERRRARGRRSTDGVAR